MPLPSESMGYTILVCTSLFFGIGLYAFLLSAFLPAPTIPVSS